MKQKYFYKVLHRVNEKLYSGGIGITTFGGKAYQEYFLGRINKPKIKGSGMFVFNNSENAFDFAQQFSEDYKIIYKVKVKNPKKKRTMCDFDGGHAYVMRFWQNRNLFTQPTPLGTYICDELELIKEIKYKH